MDAAKVIHRCLTLAACTEEPGVITRTFLSPPMREVHRLVRRWMSEAGMRVSVDAVGNVRGVWGSGPRLMIGSHLDTVPQAGAFDGILGVMMGIALVEGVKDRKAGAVRYRGGGVLRRGRCPVRRAVHREPGAGGGPGDG